MERIDVFPHCGRRLRSLLPRLALVLALAGPAVGQTSVTEVVKRANPSVVQVSVMFETYGSGRRRNSGIADPIHISRPGSGVVLHESGLVLTNAHLVAEISEDSDEFWLVVFVGRGAGFDAEVVARDERLDLALVQVNLPAGRTLPALPLGSLEGREAGERVVALGWPDSRNHYAFAGALAFSAGPMKLREEILEPDEVLLSDTRFHDLLDGGPLIDTRGRILGLHNSSHLSKIPPDFEEEEEEEEKKVSTDYAVIVSADAIRSVFGKWLDGEETPEPPLAKGQPEEATVAIQTIAPSVVSVWTGAAEEYPETTDPADPQAQRLPATLGSGVVVDSAGLVLTASDIFEDDVETAICRLPSGETYPAKLLERKPSKKVALLKLELPEGTLLSAAALGDSTQAMPGEFVAVVGRPYGRTLTLSVGVLSALERKEFVPAAMGGIGFVQLASWVHPGHWGGALVDRTGRLIGIAVQQPPGTDGVFAESYLGFASPIAAIRESFAEAWTDHGSTGGVPEPVAYTEAEIGLRKGAVARVAERTLSSLLAVHVSKAVEQEAKGFNPFGDTEEKTFTMLGQGSGVIIDESGLALSNWHVVDAAMTDTGQSDDYLVEVKLSDGRKYGVDVLSTSRDDDLALLSIRLNGDSVTPVVLGDSDALVMGEPVVAIGNPHGLSDSVSAGIISNTDIDAKIRGRARIYNDLLMTDAAINPGNSGGAMLDLEGRLVGINSAGRTGAGMAIPVNKAREVFSDKLLSAEKLRSAYLGLKTQEVEGGVEASWIDPYGPAELAKLEVGDRILRLGDAEVSTGVAFAQVRLAARAGVATPLVVERDGEELTLSITPLSYQAWMVFQQCGIEVAEVDYAGESALVQDASVALYRAYTGDGGGLPSQLMTGALRVTRAYALEGQGDLDVLSGDLLLGMMKTERRVTGDSQVLVRFESVADLFEAFAPLVTREGEECECWILREGEIRTTKVFVRKP